MHQVLGNCPDQAGRVCASRSNRDPLRVYVPRDPDMAVGILFEILLRAIRNLPSVGAIGLVEHQSFKPTIARPGGDSRATAQSPWHEEDSHLICDAGQPCWRSVPSRHPIWISNVEVSIVQIAMQVHNRDAYPV